MAEVLKGNQTVSKYSIGDILTIVQTDPPLGSDEKPNKVILFSQDEEGDCQVFFILPKKTKASIPIQIRHGNNTLSSFVQCSQLFTFKESDLVLYDGCCVDDTEKTMRSIAGMYRYLNPQSTGISARHDCSQRAAKKQENINCNVLTFTNLVLINALDDFQQAYYTVYDRLQEYFIKDKDIESLDFVLNHLAECIPFGLFSDCFELLLNKYLWFISPIDKKMTIKPNHMRYFTWFDSRRLQDFMLTRRMKIMYPTWYFCNDDKKYLDGEGCVAFAFQKAYISFEQFVENIEVVFRRAILEERRRTNPDITSFQNRDDIAKHAYSVVEKRKKEYLSVGASILQLSNQPLHLYGLLHNTTCFQHKHPLQTKPYYAKKQNSKDIVALPVHYCPQCNKYMMGELSFSLFGECFGNFCVQIRNDSDCKSKFDDFEAASELYKLGYTVRAGKLSEYERRRLLVDILESGMLTFDQITSTIEDDIKRGQNNPIFVNAVPKWQSDLKYINEYVAQKICSANAENKE